MLKGQLSVGFIMQMALGFIILVALTYAAVGIQDSMKRETQKQALVMVVERVGTQVMGALGDLEPGQSIETVVMLPASSDEFGGQYGVSVESRHSRVYLRAQSMMWPELVARQPLYLNSSHVIHSQRISYPSVMCLSLGRSGAHYSINITC